MSTVLRTEGVRMRRTPYIGWYPGVESPASEFYRNRTLGNQALSTEAPGVYHVRTLGAPGDKRGEKRSAKVFFSRVHLAFPE